MADECSPITMKINTLLEYLKQPSTIKALGTLAGAIGYAIDPTKALEILLALQAFIGAINLFYDANPRRSVDAEPTGVAPAPAAVSSDQVAQLVRAEIARMLKARKVNAPPAA